VLHGFCYSYFDYGIYVGEAPHRQSRRPLRLMGPVVTDPIDPVDRIDAVVLFVPGVPSVPGFAGSAGCQAAGPAVQWGHSVENRRGFLLRMIA